MNDPFKTTGDKTMDRVCIYLRKSREDEELEEAFGEGETLIKHRKALLKFARENNLNIVKIHEEVASGEKLIHRPAMLELLKEVEQGLYEAVLCMDMQRLGRGDMQDQGLILNTFKQSKTKIITLRKTFDLNNEFDEEYSEFEAFMSRKEYKMITRRMQGGRVRSIEEGNYISTFPPFGYVIEETRKYRTLAPHPKQADVVKLIFDLYVNHGMGCTKIAAHLTSLGYKSYTGKKWECSAVTNIIKNQVYIGKVVWKKKCIQKSSEPGKNKVAYTRPKDEWLVADGRHPALVDKETFAKAQEMIKAKYHAPYQLTNGLQNPLAGLVVCRKCGAKMKKRPYNHGGDHIICESCSNKSSRLNHIEKRILQLLEEWIRGYELQLNVEQPEGKEKNLQLQMYKRSLAGLEKELEELKAQKLRLHDLLEQGVYSVQTFMERSDHIAERIRTVNSNVERAKSGVEDEMKRMNTRVRVIPKIKRVLELYQKTEDIVERNDLLKSVLEKVEYWKEKSQKHDDFFLVIYPKNLLAIDNLLPWSADLPDCCKVPGKNIQQSSSNS